MRPAAAASLTLILIGAAQLLLGARYTLSESAFLDVGLRYLLASDVELDGEADALGQLVADYEPLGVTVGIGWRF